MTYVQTEISDGVATISLDDPDRRNALNAEMVDEIVAAFDAVEADDAVGAVVVTGRGKAFCAGADLSHLGSSRRDGLLHIYEGFLRVGRSPLPTIAAVNGPAVGAGMNLALVCDVRLASTSARFDTRFLQLGIHPGGGHTWMLQRAVGPAAARAMLLFGEILGGAEAEQAGLVWRCVDDASLLDTAHELAARAAAAPRELTRRTKATLDDVLTIDGHDAAVARELETQLWSMDQPEFAERLAALQAKIKS
ncbi:MAG: enoyl-CoA hydratase [Acidimicrobiales bacterium]